MPLKLVHVDLVANVVHIKRVRDCRHSKNIEQRWANFDSNGAISIGRAFKKSRFIVDADQKKKKNASRKWINGCLRKWADMNKCPYRYFGDVYREIGIVKVEIPS